LENLFPVRDKVFNLHIISIQTILMTDTEYSTHKAQLSGLVLENTAKIMKQSFARLLLQDPSIDVTVDQWVLLQILTREGSMPQHKLAHLSCKDAPTVTRIIDILTRKSYVRRVEHPEDRRAFLIEISDAGSELVQKILPILHDFRMKAYADLEDEDLLHLEDLLHKIVNNLSNT